eukprot:1544167-Prymnesium_polylepis.1
MLKRMCMRAWGIERSSSSQKKVEGVRDGRVESFTSTMTSNSRASDSLCNAPSEPCHESMHGLLSPRADQYPNVIAPRSKAIMHDLYTAQLLT